MGGCLTGQRKTLNDRTGKYFEAISLLKNGESQLLRLMYDDLAVRATSNKLTRQNFEVFFHLSGLWGEEIFNRFDTNKHSELDFEEFRKGIEQLVKGEPEERVQALFCFYDINKTNGISYEELLKMLYSYPKEELKKVIDDDKFLNAMNPQERQYHFGKAKVLDDARQVVEEVEEESSTGSDGWRKEKMASDVPREAVIVEGSPEKIEKKVVPKPTRAPLFKQTGSALMEPTVIVEQPCSKRTKRSGSISYFEPSGKRSFKMSSNITLVVKKYATFLFKQFKLEKDRDELSLQQFMTLVEKHKKLFTSYFQGFHNYVWEVNGQEIPLSKLQDCWIQGFCEQVNLRNGTASLRFLRFVRTTLFVYERSSDSLPLEIKNLQGLLVEQFNRGSGQKSRGFIIKHRDGLYPQKAFLFESEYEQEEWLRHLKHFRNNSIFDFYQLQQKIGAGNFSVVYRGVEKQTKLNVAVKVIQKFKLTEIQNEVIKRECSVLELCHHPCIIKYKQKIESKTHIFIVTEYMSEGGLYEYVKRRGFLEEYEASLIMKQLFDTILYLNSLSIIHRDIKAQNIMIRLNKEKTMVQKVKIIDFGFAVFQEALKNMNTREKYAGTPGYLAPEVLQLKEFDQTVDNFSLGVILYFILSGVLPFHSHVQEDVVEMTLRCNVTLCNNHWNNISQNGKDLLNRLLCHKQERITLEDAIKHPWITDRDELKSLIGKNPPKPKKL